MGNKQDYLQKADQRVRDLFKSATTRENGNMAVLYISPEVKGAVSEETDERVAQYWTGQGIAFAAIRSEMQKIGVVELPQMNTQFLLAIRANKQQLQALARCPHVHCFRANVGDNGHLEGKFLDLTR